MQTQYKVRMRMREREREKERERKGEGGGDGGKSSTGGVHMDPRKHDPSLIFFPSSLPPFLCPSLPLYLSPSLSPRPRSSTWPR